MTGAARATLRTLGTLTLLQVVLPLNLAVTGVQLVRRRREDAAPAPLTVARTILISGGKMTKALALARAFHRAGHRVVLVETATYRYTGHRFSRAVDRFYTVPAPGGPGYTDALLEIVRAEGIDVYVPVCAPAASYPDAVAGEVLSAYCEVLHGTPEVIARLDDKFEFSAMATEVGLSVPECHRITSPQQLRDFDFGSRATPFILKSLAYDPVNRLDLTRLPTATPEQLEEFLADKPISEANPWILQAFIAGDEYCTHSTVRGGRVQVYCCCPSSAFQINYEMVDKPQIRDWVGRFVLAHALTGQVSFDFIEAPDGQVYAIECNPRTHSAITMFYDHPQLADAYLQDGHPVVTPLPSSRPTYWIYHEVWRLLTRPGDVPGRLRTIARGKDAIFDAADPLPFLLVHHLQIPSLLLHNLVRLKDWIRVDFNIGKLVQAAGD
ncbi:hypothetical protein [Allobranchiibius sp. CTAmp26]|uniref:hypothetical protein n=1 Tax=Allobranchiibius sp. CTAmp26 TaxID=2815214 RepID=UPI001AA17B30|nr:hypothetical protein [Allobranchiibius sp. CTAmp26]MBO1755464.1 hypothetical protein [Allobranchiibius sp. CTAmp26]